MPEAPRFRQNDINRDTRRLHEPRGLFCAIGQCTDCAVVVNGRPNVRTCIVPVQDGMVVETQDVALSTVLSIATIPVMTTFFG